MPATDVHDMFKLGEVVDRRNHGGHRRCSRGHGLVEDGGLFRVLRQVLEYTHAKDMVKRNVAGLDAVQKIVPRAHGGPGEQKRKRAGCAGHSGSQALADGRQREKPGLVLGKYSNAGEHAHQPV